MIKWLFILSVISIAFSDFFSLLPLGEMQHELSSYVFIFTIMITFSHYIFFGSRKNNTPVYGLKPISIILLSIIILSCILNLPSIIGVDFRGRNALNKFFTSSMVVVYGIAIAYLSYYAARKYSVKDLVIRPTTWAIIINIVVVAIEVASWNNSAADKILDFISIFIHTGSQSEVTGSFVGGAFGWGKLAGRAEGTAFEPPALANYLGFAWVWLYAGYLESKRYKKVFYSFLMIATAIIPIVASNSRTGLLLIIGNIISLILLKYFYLPAKPLKMQMVRIWLSSTLIALIAMTVGFIIYNNDAVVEAILKSDNLSNVARYASNITGYRMFNISPIYGLGFGQYGFYVRRLMPDWGYQSWEISSWLQDPMVVWPPVFSMYARFAGELGILGLGFWIILWLFLADRIIKTTIIYQKATGILPNIARPLAMGCYAILFSGIPSDSLHNPFIWITLGLSCHYIYDIKMRISAIAHESDIKSIS